MSHLADGIWRDGDLASSDESLGGGCRHSLQTTDNKQQSTSQLFDEPARSDEERVAMSHSAEDVDIA
jgi:hypothetical protein